MDRLSSDRKARHDPGRMYADDGVTFVAPDRRGRQACARIMHGFGLASGLKMNLTLSVLLISSNVLLRNLRRFTELRCQVLHFPCQYLGMPPVLRKPSTTQLQPLVDKVADRLPGWRFIAAPEWQSFAGQHNSRGYAYTFHGRARHSNQDAEWGPADFQGFPDLRLLNLALRARSPWLERVVDKKLWRLLNIQAHDESLAIFYAPTKSELGNRAITLFYAARSVDPVSLRRRLRLPVVNHGDADVACLR
jgi:hypothetical protein